MSNKKVEDGHGLNFCGLLRISELCKYDFRKTLALLNSLIHCLLQHLFVNFDSLMIEKRQQSEFFSNTNFLSWHVLTQAITNLVGHLISFLVNNVKKVSEIFIPFYFLYIFPSSSWLSSWDLLRYYKLFLICTSLLKL